MALGFSVAVADPSITYGTTPNGGANGATQVVSTPDLVWKNGSGLLAPTSGGIKINELAFEFDGRNGTDKAPSGSLSSDKYTITMGSTVSSNRQPYLLFKSTQGIAVNTLSFYLTEGVGSSVSNPRTMELDLSGVSSSSYALKGDLNILIAETWSNHNVSKFIGKIGGKGIEGNVTLKKHNLNSDVEGSVGTTDFTFSGNAGITGNLSVNLSYGNNSFVFDQGAVGGKITIGGATPKNDANYGIEEVRSYASTSILFGKGSDLTFNSTKVLLTSGNLTYGYSDSANGTKVITLTQNDSFIGGSLTLKGMKQVILDGDVELTSKTRYEDGGKSVSESMSIGFVFNESDITANQQNNPIVVGNINATNGNIIFGLNNSSQTGSNPFDNRSDNDNAPTNTYYVDGNIAITNGGLSAFWDDSKGFLGKISATSGHSITQIGGFIGKNDAWFGNGAFSNVNNTISTIQATSGGTSHLVFEDNITISGVNDESNTVSIKATNSNTTQILFKGNAQIDGAIKAREFGTNRVTFNGSNNVINTIDAISGNNIITFGNSTATNIIKGNITVSMGTSVAAGVQNVVISKGNLTFGDSTQSDGFAILTGSEGWRHTKARFDIAGETTFAEDTRIVAFFNYGNNNDIDLPIYNVFKFGGDVTATKISELTTAKRWVATPSKIANILSFESANEQNLTIDYINKKSTINSYKNAPETGINYIGKGITTGEGESLVVNSALFEANGGWDSDNHRANVNLTITNDIYLYGGANYINVKSLNIGGNIKADKGTNYINVETLTTTNKTAIVANGGSNNIYVKNTSNITINGSVDQNGSLADNQYGILSHGGGNTFNLAGNNTILTVTNNLYHRWNASKTEFNVSGDNSTITIKGASVDGEGGEGLIFNFTGNNGTLKIGSSSGDTFTAGAITNGSGSSNAKTTISFAQSGIIQGNIRTQNSSKTNITFGKENSPNTGTATIMGNISANGGTNTIIFNGGTNTIAGNVTSEVGGATGGSKNAIISTNGLIFGDSTAITISTGTSGWGSNNKNIFDITGTTIFNNNTSIIVKNNSQWNTDNNQNIFKFNGTVTSTSDKQITEVTAAGSYASHTGGTSAHNILSFEGSSQSDVTIGDINKSTTLNSLTSGNNYIGKNLTTGSGNTLAFNSNLFSNNDWKTDNHQANIYLTVTGNIFTDKGINYVNVKQLTANIINVTSTGANNITLGGNSLVSGNITKSGGGSNNFTLGSDTTLTLQGGTSNITTLTAYAPPTNSRSSGVSTLTIDGSLRANTTTIDKLANGENLVINFNGQGSSNSATLKILNSSANDSNITLRGVTLADTATTDNTLDLTALSNTTITNAISVNDNQSLILKIGSTNLTLTNGLTTQGISEINAIGSSNTLSASLGGGNISASKLNITSASTSSTITFKSANTTFDTFATDSSSNNITLDTTASNVTFGTTSSGNNAVTFSNITYQGTSAQTLSINGGTNTITTLALGTNANTLAIGGGSTTISGAINVDADKDFTLKIGSNIEPEKPRDASVILNNTITKSDNGLAKVVFEGGSSPTDTNHYSALVLGQGDNQLTSITSNSKNGMLFLKNTTTASIDQKITVTNGNSLTIGFMGDGASTATASQGIEVQSGGTLGIAIGGTSGNKKIDIPSYNFDNVFKEGSTLRIDFLRNAGSTGIIGNGNAITIASGRKSMINFYGNDSGVNHNPTLQGGITLAGGENEVNFYGDATLGNITLNSGTNTIRVKGAESGITGTIDNVSATNSSGLGGVTNIIYLEKNATLKLGTNGDQVLTSTDSTKSSTLNFIGDGAKLQGGFGATSESTGSATINVGLDEYYDADKGTEVSGTITGAVSHAQLNFNAGTSILTLQSTDNTFKTINSQATNGVLVLNGSSSEVNATISGATSIAEGKSLSFHFKGNNASTVSTGSLTINGTLGIIIDGDGTKNITSDIDLAGKGTLLVDYMNGNGTVTLGSGQQATVITIGNGESSIINFRGGNGTLNNALTLDGGSNTVNFYTDASLEKITLTRGNNTINVKADTINGGITATVGTSDVGNVTNTINLEDNATLNLINGASSGGSGVGTLTSSANSNTLNFIGNNAKLQGGFGATSADQGTATINIGQTSATSVSGIITGNVSHADVVFKTSNGSLTLQGATNTIKSLTGYTPSIRNARNATVTNTLILDGASTSDVSATIASTITDTSVGLKFGSGNENKTFTFSESGNYIAGVLFDANSTNNKIAFTKGANTLGTINVASGNALALSLGNGSTDTTAQDAISLNLVGSFSGEGTKTLRIEGQNSVYATLSGEDINVTSLDLVANQGDQSSAQLTLKNSNATFGTLTANQTSTLSLDASANDVNVVISKLDTGVNTDGNSPTAKLTANFNGNANHNATLAINAGKDGGTSTQIALKAVTLANNSTNNTLDLTSSSLTKVSITDKVSVGSDSSRNGLSIKLKDTELALSGGLETNNGVSTIRVDGESTNALATLSGGSIAISNLDMVGSGNITTTLKNTSTTISAITAQGNTSNTLILDAQGASANVTATLSNTNARNLDLELKGGSGNNTQIATLNLNGGSYKSLSLGNTSDATHNLLSLQSGTTSFVDGLSVGSSKGLTLNIADGATLSGSISDEGTSIINFKGATSSKIAGGVTTSASGATTLNVDNNANGAINGAISAGGTSLDVNVGSGSSLSFASLSTTAGATTITFKQPQVSRETATLSTLKGDITTTAGNTTLTLEDGVNALYSGVIATEAGATTAIEFGSGSGAKTLTLAQGGSTLSSITASDGENTLALQKGITTFRDAISVGSDKSLRFALANSTALTLSKHISNAGTATLDLTNNTRVNSDITTTGNTAINLKGSGVVLTGSLSTTAGSTTITLEDTSSGIITGDISTAPITRARAVSAPASNVEFRGTSTLTLQGSNNALSNIDTTNASSATLVIDGSTQSNTTTINTVSGNNLVAYFKGDDETYTKTLKTTGTVTLKNIQLNPFSKGNVLDLTSTTQTTITDALSIIATQGLSIKLAEGELKASKGLNMLGDSAIEVGDKAVSDGKGAILSGGNVNVSNLKFTGTSDAKITFKNTEVQIANLVKDTSATGTATLTLGKGSKSVTIQSTDATFNAEFASDASANQTLAINGGTNTISTLTLGNRTNTLSIGGGNTTINKAITAEKGKNLTLALNSSSSTPHSTEVILNQGVTLNSGTVGVTFDGGTTDQRYRSTLTLKGSSNTLSSVTSNAKNALINLEGSATANIANTTINSGGTLIFGFSGSRDSTVTLDKGITVGSGATLGISLGGSGTRAIKVSAGSGNKIELKTGSTLLVDFQETKAGDNITATLGNDSGFTITEGSNSIINLRGGKGRSQLEGGVTLDGGNNTINFLGSSTLSNITLNSGTNTINVYDASEQSKGITGTIATTDVGGVTNIINLNDYSTLSLTDETNTAGSGSLLSNSLGNTLNFIGVGATLQGGFGASEGAKAVAVLNVGSEGKSGVNGVITGNVSNAQAVFKTSDATLTLQGENNTISSLRGYEGEDFYITNTLVLDSTNNDVNATITSAVSGNAVGLEFGAGSHNKTFTFSESGNNISGGISFDGSTGTNTLAFTKGSNTLGGVVIDTDQNLTLSLGDAQTNSSASSNAISLTLVDDFKALNTGSANIEISGKENVYATLSGAGLDVTSLTLSATNSSTLVLKNYSSAFGTLSANNAQEHNTLSLDATDNSVFATVRGQVDAAELTLNFNAKGSNRAELALGAGDNTLKSITLGNNSSATSGNKLILSSGTTSVLQQVSIGANQELAFALDADHVELDLREGLSNAGSVIFDFNAANSTLMGNLSSNAQTTFNLRGDGSSVVAVIEGEINFASNATQTFNINASDVKIEHINAQSTPLEFAQGRNIINFQQDATLNWHDATLSTTGGETQINLAGNATLINDVTTSGGSTTFNLSNKTLTLNDSSTAYAIQTLEGGKTIINASNGAKIFGNVSSNGANTTFNIGSAGENTNSAFAIGDESNTHSIEAVNKGSNTLNLNSTTNTFTLDTLVADGGINTININGSGTTTLNIGTMTQSADGKNIINLNTSNSTLAFETQNKDIATTLSIRADGITLPKLYADSVDDHIILSFDGASSLTLSNGAELSDGKLSVVFNNGATLTLPTSHSSFTSVVSNSNGAMIDLVQEDDRANPTTDFRLLTIGDKISANDDGLSGNLNAKLYVNKESISASTPTPPADSAPQSREGVDTSADATTQTGVTLGGVSANSNDHSTYGYAHSDRIIINDATAPSSLVLNVVPKLDQLLDLGYSGEGTQKEGNIALVTVAKDANVSVSTEKVTVGFEEVVAELQSETTDESGAINESGAYITYFLGGAKSMGASVQTQEVASAALTVNYDLFLANFNSLNKRMGELRDNAHNQGVWARIFGGAMSNDFGAGSKTQYVTAQAGYDYSLSLGDARNYMGIALAYGTSSTKSNTLTQSGVIVGSTPNIGLDKVSSNMVEVGVYNSYVSDSGWYNDTIFKFDYIMSEFAMTNNLSQMSETNNFAVVLSDEFGYRYSFGESEKGSWYIDPQAEFGLGWFNQSDFNRTLESNLTGTSTLKAMQDSILTLRSRAGLSLGKKFNTERGFASLYVGAFYEYDYIEGGNAEVSMGSGVSNGLQSIESNGRAIINVGSNIELTEGARLYIDVEKSFGDKQRTHMQFNFGARYSFGERSATPSKQTQQRKEIAPLKVSEENASVQEDSQTNSQEQEENSTDKTQEEKKGE